MTVCTCFCDTCKQFLPVLIINDSPYFVCSVHEEDRFNELLGYDRGDIESELHQHYNFLPKIKKAPK